MDWTVRGLSHFQDHLSLNRSHRNIVIVGSGIGALFLVIKGWNSYQKAQRRYLNKNAYLFSLFDILFIRDNER